MSENAPIVANFDKTIDPKDFKFHFKKDKELGNKRESIELKLPTPSVEGIIAIIEKGGKGLDLLLGAAADVIVSQARNILNDNEEMKADSFPFEQCTWEFIANLPDAEKRGRGIPKETWEEFAADYTAVMPGLTNKKVEQVALAAKLLVTKYNNVKTNKPVIKLLMEQLALYSTGSPNAEQYQDCIKFLQEKGEALLKADPAAMLANL